MLRWNLKKIFFLSLFFTLLIFAFRVFFLSDKNKEILEEKYIDITTYGEEIYNKIEVSEKTINDNNEINIEIDDTNIEPTVAKEIINESTEVEDNKVIDKYIERLQSNMEKEDVDISFIYIPSSLKNIIKQYSNNINSYLNSKTIVNKLEWDITIEFYKDLVDIRWKMKAKKIKLFWPEKMWEAETMSVFVHELWHYVDLYFFPKKGLVDKSQKFYNISWNDIKNMKKGQENKDFVSGYSMSNRYEDFAESFVYYILHNKDFLEKTEKSYILKEKYDFFGKYLFTKEEFIWTDFSENNEVKNYYRDITKIEINLEIFLQYVKKVI